jgi:putative methyltransferase (TIGR04325 family)
MDRRILERVQLSTLAVIRGEAAFERDGVAFAQPETNWPVAAALMLGAVRSGGELSVLDFGGSLGSQYFQSRGLLRQVPGLRWTVVEQPTYVAAGSAMVDVPEVTFLEASDPLVPWGSNVALFGSVLQYLEDPFGPLKRVIAAGADVIIIDRSPVSQSERDRPTIQISPMPFGTSSYPAWILSEPALLEAIGRTFSLQAMYETQPGSMVTATGLPVQWRGFIFVRRSESE